MTDLDARKLLFAYGLGFFPMADGRDSKDVFWLNPDHRAVLPLDRFYVPRRLARTVRQGRFEISIDRDFDAVIGHCADGGRGDSWINRDILSLHRELNDIGAIHTVECRTEGALVGGLYGISLGAAFFGESMFTLARDASKVALVHLVARLAAGGYRLLDTQFLTDHIAQFGGVRITRDRYQELLAEAVVGKAALPNELDDEAFDAFLRASREVKPVQGEP